MKELPLTCSSIITSRVCDMETAPPALAARLSVNSALSMVRLCVSMQAMAPPIPPAYTHAWL